MSEMTDRTENPIQVADRIFQTIELLAQTGPAGLLELSRGLSLNKSTVHRILTSLIYLGYVKQDKESAKYSLSFKLCDIANRLLSKIDMIEIARPHLKHLAEITGETVHLVQIDDFHAVYIDKVESYRNSVRMVSKVGKRIPLYCSGVGKALLAEMSEEAVADIWGKSDIQPVTPFTITDYKVFCKQLCSIRELGYALDNEENEVGVRCIAAAVKDYAKVPRYAFSVSAPISRMGDDRIALLSEEILSVRQDLEDSWH